MRMLCVKANVLIWDDFSGDLHLRMWVLGVGSCTVCALCVKANALIWGDFSGDLHLWTWVLGGGELSHVCVVCKSERALIWDDSYGEECLRIHSATLSGVPAGIPGLQIRSVLNPM
jgi:hypothetical protein